MIQLRNDRMRMNISTNGAYVTHISFDGHEIIKKGDIRSKTHGGIAPLFPYANRIENGAYEFEGVSHKFKLNKEGNSSHGFGKDMEWDETVQEENKVQMKTLLHDEGYPFQVNCSIEFSLMESGFSIISNFLCNEGQAPVSPGFHPYFNSGPNWKLKFLSKPLKVIKKDSFFPSGSYLEYFKTVKPRTVGTYDDCFKYTGPLSIQGDSFIYNMETIGSKYIMLYNGKYAGKNYIAVEPMSSAINAFNTGEDLIILMKDQSFNFGFSVRILEI